MIVKTNKLINQDSREDYNNEAAEGATVLLQDDKEFDRTDDEF